MIKDSKNTICSAHNSFVHIYVVDNTSTSLLRIGGAFLFASTQPFNWHCDFIGINQLREVIFKIVYICKFYHLHILLVPALLAVTGDLNQIVSDGESLGRDILNTQRVQGTLGN